MGRAGSVAVLVVLGVASVAAAKPLEPACVCSHMIVVPERDAVVPQNAKLWVLDPTQLTVRLEGGGMVRNLELAWDPAVHAMAFTPQLTPGHYHFHSNYFDTTFDVRSGLDAIGPDVPAINGVSIVSGPGNAIALLSIQGRFDADTALVRVTIATNPPQIITTLPSRLDLCETGLSARPGLVQVTIEALDVAGNASLPVTIPVEVAAPDRGAPPSCHERFTCGLGNLGAAIGRGLLSLILFVGALAVRYARRRPLASAPAIVSLLVADELARGVRLRGALVMTAMVVLTPVAWAAYGAIALIGPCWVLVCLGEVVDASRIVRLVDAPNAIATIGGRELVVRSGTHKTTLVVTDRALRRASAAAVPAAKEV
jgi:hypothetical protein